MMLTHHYLDIQHGTIFHSNDSLNTLNKEYCEEELDDIINFS